MPFAAIDSGWRNILDTLTLMPISFIAALLAIGAAIRAVMLRDQGRHRAD